MKYKLSEVSVHKDYTGSVDDFDLVAEHGQYDSLKDATVAMGHIVSHPASNGFIVQTVEDASQEVIDLVWTSFNYI